MRTKEKAQMEEVVGRWEGVVFFFYDEKRGFPLFVVLNLGEFLCMVFGWV